jgi:hypothetical protein
VADINIIINPCVLIIYILLALIKHIDQTQRQTHGHHPGSRLHLFGILHFALPIALSELGQIRVPPKIPGSAL